MSDNGNILDDQVNQCEDQNNDITENKDVKSTEQKENIIKNENLIGSLGSKLKSLSNLRSNSLESLHIQNKTRLDTELIQCLD